MPIGPGKYDDIVSDVRVKTGAEGVLLLVIKGSRGSGMSAQLSLELTLTLPEILRTVAQQIEDGAPAAEA